MVKNANKGVWTHAHLDRDINGLAILLERAEQSRTLFPNGFTGVMKQAESHCAAEWERSDSFWK
jgi:hypothetical protein